VQGRGQEQPGQTCEQPVCGEGGERPCCRGDGEPGRARTRRVDFGMWRRMWRRRTRLGHNPEAGQRDRSEPEDHEVGQRQLQLAPLREQAGEQRVRSRVRRR
jgi:hypothetical protein